MTIKRTRVRPGGPNGFCGSNVIRMATAGISGVMIVDVEVDGQSIDAFGTAIAGSGYTCLRCNVHNSGDGFKAENYGSDHPVVIQDSWVHDLYIRDDLGSHNQAVGTNGFSAGYVIRHNNLENWDGQTSAISLFADFSPVQNVTVDNNLLNGGGYSLYGASGDGKAYSGQTVNIKVTNNHFGAKFYPQCGQYGPVTYFSPSASGNLWSGNVWDRTGAPLNP